MPIQVTEVIETGQMIVSSNRAAVLTVAHLSTGIAVIMYDTKNKVGGIANIALPDSHQDLSKEWQHSNPAQYADVALPTFWEKFQSVGATVEHTWAKLVGGAQLFNFSGGAGNALNIGSRNLVAVRTVLSQLGIPLEKADTGGNRAKQVRFTVALGQLAVRKLGDSKEYLI